MKIVIIEDEAATRRMLKNTIEQIVPQAEIVKQLGDVQGSVTWLKENSSKYDLLFMDIRLSDGLSFEICKQVEIQVPIIFVTAYDEYALEAFRTTGIAYVLKPVDEVEVRAALQKYDQLAGKEGSENRAGLNDHLELLIRKMTIARSYRQSFLVHYRDRLIPVKTTDLEWICTENEVSFACSRDGRTYQLDGSLEKLMIQLDPKQFYRVNRQFIVNREAILEVHFYFNGRLMLELKQSPKERVLVSKAKVPEFRAWMEE